MFSLKLTLIARAKAATRSTLALPRKAARTLCKAVACAKSTPCAQPTTTMDAFQPLVAVVYRAKHASLAQQATDLSSEHQQHADDMRLATGLAAAHNTQLTQLIAELDALQAASAAKAKAIAETHHQYQDLADAVATERHASKQALRAKDLAHFEALEALSAVEGQIAADTRTHKAQAAELQAMLDELARKSRQLTADKRRVEGRAEQQRRDLLAFARAMKRPAVAAVQAHNASASFRLSL
ncbi:hypothetical protein H4R35_007375 [Dimargaris xerosporica]|nr:hypothetical protein H4R35_007375 [Dimargaris xerosporica]